MDDLEWYIFTTDQHSYWHFFRHCNLKQAVDFIRSLNEILWDGAPWKGRLMTEDEINEEFAWNIKGAEYCSTMSRFDNEP